MISKTELKWIKEELESGKKVHAILANKIITSLKNQQDQIKQLETQIKSIQSNVPLIEKNAILNMIDKLDDYINCDKHLYLTMMVRHAEGLVK